MINGQYISSEEKKDQLIKQLQAEVKKQRLENLSLKNELQNLGSSKEKFSKVFNDNHAMMAIVTVSESRFVEVNNTALKRFGYKAEEVLGMSLLERDLWSDLQEREEMINLLNANGYLDNFECTLKKKSGDKVDLMCSVNLLVIDGVQCMLVSAAEITKRKQAEEALRQSQKLLYQIFNHTPLPIIIATIKDKRIIEVNDAYLKRKNLVRENFLEQKNPIFDEWEDANEMDQYIKMIMRDGMVKNFEMKNHIPTGEIRTVLVSGVLIRWQGEDCILSIGNDITEVRKYRDEMFRLENQNMIGQMAAGIAHEIRNPMTSVRGFLQLFQSKEAYSEDRASFDLIIEELDSANEIITTFLSLAQKSNIDLKLQNLNDNIINLFPSIMADALKNDIFIKMELRDVVPIMIDEGEIRRLLRNLVHNGMDAMSGGGILTIRTFQDNNGVNLVIQDKGHGITSEIMGKIGTPFFTTKDKGTGLGLAVCYSIAERHNARINIKTSADGTIFDVIFPVE